MLTCTYNSENRNTVTLGGESTYEEMCLSFLNYYPRMGMTDCYSLSYPQSFRQFLSRHYSQSEIAGIFSNSPENGLTRSEVDEIFNNITWTHEETEVLENSLSTGSQISFCYGPSLYAEALQNVPSIGCPYEAPPVMLECPDSVDPTTNPTTDPTTDPTSGAVSLITLSVTVLLFAMIAMILIN
ncbi:PREDICTED: DBH-like monooxygenase protein 1 [Amphimedon queenslandica]|nr:PREDICTED: DBH-like monooxygenase protein 1 [Amphimedon queenslandica]|eukprot:XP_003389081.1 PREDICTED: DBH-like monooxygenase protein 1 [Amphimedon queenslandica]